MTHEPTGLVVTSLRGTLDGSDSPFQDLNITLSWLREYGIAPASLSSMSWSLWRASLSAPAAIGFDPNVSRQAVYGGRQEITEPRVFQHMVSADIRSAYPFSMASNGYAVSLRPVSASTVLDPNVPGLARATIFVDRDMPYAPLPTRIAPGLIQFQWGTVKGVYPWVELVAAEAVGATVRIEESWAPRRVVDLFGDWWDLTQEGRRLPGNAAIMAKSIANSCWGQFGMTGYDRAVIRWTDEKGEDPFPVYLPGRPMPHEWTAHIAAETTGRVRSRMLSEGLYGGTVRPVHVDTDGVIMRRRAPVPSPAGDGPGEWRVKDRMKSVDIKAPQLYRYTCTQLCGSLHPKWHYVASGMTPTQAPEFFRRGAESHTKIAYLNAFDNVLPPAHSDDPNLTTLNGVAIREARVMAQAADEGKK
jgi:hypothetical protein